MFNLRFVSPVTSPVQAVDGVGVADAVGAFLANNLSKCLFVRAENGSGSRNETAYFALVEAEGHGTLVGRHIYAGIGRKGGSRLQHPRERKSLAEVEQALGLAEGFLSEDDWEGEESLEDAYQRTRRA